MRKFIGFLATALGLLGLVVSVAAVVGLWWMRGQVTERVTRMAEAIAPLLGSIGNHVDVVAANLETTRTRIQDMAVAANQVAEKEDLSDKVDREKLEVVFDRVSLGLEQTENLLGFLQVGVSTIQTGTQAVEAVPMMGSSADQASPELATHVQNASATVERAAKELKSIEQNVKNLKNNGEVQANARKVASLAKTIDDHLAPLKERILEAGQQIAKAGEKVTEFKEKVSFWLTTGAVIGTLLLVWIALGQVALMVCGWWMLRGPQSS